MGKYGSAILTIAGTIIGAYFGVPQLGAALGAIAGSLLFPQQLPTVQGPKLSDLSQTTSSIGTSIPRGWGVFPVPGCIIAKSDIREVIETDEVGGKGGPSQTVETPTYYQDFAVGLVDSEDPILGFEPIAGIRRIWSNGKLIYDRRPQQAGESDSAFNNRIAASDVLDEGMVVYLGTEDQLPDPTLEAFYGVGNIAAFRGLAYVVFINWQNKPEDGNRMPSSLKFEVYTAGAIDESSAYEYSNEILFPWSANAGVLRDPRDLRNEHRFKLIGESISSLSYDVGPWRDSLSGALGDSPDVFPDGFPTPRDPISGATYELGWSANPAASNWSSALRPHIVSSNPEDRESLFMHIQTLPDSGGDFIKFVDKAQWIQSVDGDCISLIIAEALPFGGAYMWWSDLFSGYPGEPAGGDPFVNQYELGMYFWWDLDDGEKWPRQYFNNNCIDPLLEPYGPQDAQLMYVPDIIVEVQRVPRAPWDPCNPPADIAATPPPFGATGTHCIVDGQIRQAGEWELHAASYLVLQEYVTDGGALQIVQYPLSPARPVGHADNTEAFWTPQYERAVAYGFMDPGLVYGVDYPVAQGFAYRRLLTQSTIEIDPISIADPVRDICLESGLRPDEIDVSDLATSEILGYVRPRVMLGRAALEPLRMTAWFDGIESERTIKFVRRGKPVVLTLTEDELGSAVIGETKPSKITTRKLMEFDLPRQVRVHYLSYTRDYENGEQSSPVRLDVDAVNEQDVELAVVMLDEQAAQIAEVLWADAWASRWVHEITIDARYARLEPADAIAVPVDGRAERMRILEITDKLPNDRTLSLVRDDDGTYVSYAVASSVPVVPPPMTIFGPAELILLDLPLLRDEDNDAGIYAAMRGQLDDNFTGAQIYRSTDGGGNYNRIGQSGSEATIGFLTQALPSGPSSIWDEGNELFIELETGELENRTEAAVLEGANGAAIGADGRWEIVQFRNVELVTGAIYKLTGLLRGRRGTEQYIDSSAAEDRFVLLSGPGIVRLPLPLSGVNREYQYKGVGTGTTLDAATEIDFTGRGVALQPFSPVKVEGYRSSATGAWSITWIRRGRIGETLQAGADIPLSETLEDYEVDVLDEDGAVKRTISVSEPEALYSADQQTLDFGAQQQTSLSVVVYQISNQVGRGTGTEATL